VDRPTRRSSETATGSRTEPPAAEPRQRWRITFTREAVSSERVGRVALDEWQRALTASRLPTLETAGRARLAIAAPLPAAARGERELAELWLVDRRAAWQVREALDPVLPAGHGLVDTEDVWLGAPAIVAQVTAADWRIELARSGTDRDSERLRAAVDEMNDARAIPRVRLKGTTEKRYDLRPLLSGIRFERGPDGAEGGPIVRARTRFHPELGAGRPDEVVAALAEASGLPLEVRTLTRTRLLLAEGSRRN
jgi:hypothetical protein